MLPQPASPPLITEDLSGRSAAGDYQLGISGQLSGTPYKASATKRITACNQPGQATWRARPNVYYVGQWLIPLPV
jgi:hypothetical protein